MKEPDGAGGTGRSRRNGVPRCRMDDARPRRSWREKGAQLYIYIYIYIYIYNVIFFFFF